MNGSTRKMVAAGAAVLLTLGITTAAMADASAPAKPAAAPAEPMKSMKSMHTKKHAPSEMVKSIQEALNKNGAKLDVDGYWGKKTHDALKTFQSSHGLKATGHADKKTKEALGLKS